MTDVIKRLAALAMVVSVVGVFTLGSSLVHGDGDDDDDGDDTVTVQFGESEGTPIAPPGMGPPPPADHHLIVDPGSIDEDTTVFFDINQSAFGDPALGGIHQVVILEVGTQDGQVPAPLFNPVTEEGLFIYNGTQQLPLPLPPAALLPLAQIEIRCRKGRHE